ncbi:MAG TPA: aromatic aminobenezylarsenical efflux permease ArsG family transporter, partial [Vicinamibacteria bacterium]
AVSASAFWLGLLTSVSPCPLAANIAAMSYIGREVGSRRRTLVGGLLYTLGRTLAYAALAAILVGGLLSVPEVALFLQAHLNRALGPLLVATGLVLLEWVRLPGFGSRAYDQAGRRLLDAGLLGAFPLGAVLALAFCPVSAGLFFGGLIPLALEQRSSLWLPALYGLGTGLPVVVFAVLVSAGLAFAGAAFNRLQAVERGARRATALVVIAVGLYYTWSFTIRGRSSL